jgi:hypothetical protein
MSDHSFPECAVNAFVVTGDYDFINPISSQPWGGRSQKIAKQRIFEKYLTTEDVMKAAWLQKQANLKPRTPDTQYTGCAYMNGLMEQRSNGQCWKEMQALAKSLPTPFEYAVDHFGPLPEAPKEKVTLSIVKAEE